MDLKRLASSWTFWAATFTALAASVPMAEAVTTGKSTVIQTLPELAAVWGAWLTVSGARNALYKIESPAALPGDPK